jgi:hypothetical protein
MKKGLIVLLILGLTCWLAGQALAQETAKGLAQVKLKDVPDDHWAAGAVYDLVKMGVTKGYPDGTFRGTKPITRFETAIFLSKLAKAVGGDDLKAEIKALRDQLVEIKQAPKESLVFSGNYEGDWRVGNLMATAGASREGLSSYRLVVAAQRELGQSADIKIRLDTMDYGFFDDGSTGQVGRGLLASDLLDIESNIKLDLSEVNLSQPVNLKLTYGPGPKQHGTDPTGAFPSEIGLTYRRPETGVLASTKLFGADLRGGYYSLQGATLETSGQITTGKLTGGLSFLVERFLLLNSLKIDLTGDYISRGLFSSSERSLKAKLDLQAPLGAKAQAQTTVGIGRKPSQMMVAGTVALQDPLETGTVISLNAVKIGSEYIDTRFAAEQFDLAGYDNFDRPLINGTVNFGGQLVQQINDKARFVGKGDVRLTGDYKYEGSLARATVQGGFSYLLAPNVNLDAAYRVHQDRGTRDTTDMAAVGLLYKF